MVTLYKRTKTVYNITHDDYTFAENEMSETWAVRLKTQYKDVLYEYGRVSATVDEIVDNGDGEATLSFQYNVIDSGEYEEKDLTESEDFNNYVGAVLQHIITDAFDTGKYKIGEHATDDTDNNPKEPAH